MPDSVTTTDLLGPLTTVFTPPAPCLATATYNPSALDDGDGKPLTAAVLYGATGLGVDLACYPPGYVTNHAYSPGVCPSGWTSACKATTTDGHSAFFPSATVGVQCCPAGFHCDDFWWCAKEPVETSIPVWTIYTGKYGIEGDMTSAAYPRISPLAKPIFVAYESSDLDLLASATMSNSSIIPAATTSTGSENSLSGGEVAGIAVGGVAAGILLTLLCMTACFCLGFRITRAKTTLPGGDSVHELAGKDSQRDSYPELPATAEPQVAELGATKAERRPELAAFNEAKT